MKKLLLIVAIPVLVIVLGIVGLVTLVNPNQFKPMIIEQVKNQTGLDLEVKGDIGWQFFPSVGLELGRTELKNPQGFSKPNLFAVDQVSVSVSVVPLLSQQLDIGSVTLDGAQVYLETLKDGRSNLDSINQSAQTTQDQNAAAEQETAPTDQSSDSKSSASNWQITLNGVTVSNAQLEVNNFQTDSFTKLSNVGLNISEFVADQWTKADFSLDGENNQQKFTAKGSLELKLSQDFKQYQVKNIDFAATYNDGVNQVESAQLTLATFNFDQANRLDFSALGMAADMKFDAKGGTDFTLDSAISKLDVKQLTLDAKLEGEALPKSAMDINMASDLSFDISKGFLDFVLESLSVNNITLDGKATVQLDDIPKVRFSLHSANIDLDEFLGLDQQQSADNSETNKPASTASAQEVEPDLSALKQLDVQGDIVIDKFKASNAHMQNVKTNFHINRGVASLNAFSSQLYDGTITAKGQLNANTSPATYSAVKTIKGVKVQPMLKDVADNDMLEGTGNIDVNVKGKGLAPTTMKKNLTGTVKINFADGAVNGINVAQIIRENYAKFKGESLEGTSGPQKTDFSAMTATLNLANGVVSTTNLTAESPLLRIHGEGSADYVNETVDFLVRTSVVGSLEGQGGKTIDDLKDVTIPIKITHTWSDPKFALVFDDVLKQKAQKEVERVTDRLGIKDEKTKEAVDGLLKGLFN
ncbi:AsmA family protein [Vibrio hippocampi]|uniref:AsmA domain-containing protein n=1 Tax=Vibrio hippocampi TaxID=654686 RepID=A0ABN8DE85_9VIBR|nr:AsmA family protein [Vibrio hippocampi]CAH0525392.1 hypothetical protein VHP8226_00952 [Vibrio hippocampi]